MTSRSLKDDAPELELTDNDILEAMASIPGYLDITTEDFRAIYRLAHRHAVDRIFRQVKASSLMQRDIEPLYPEMMLDEAARHFASQGRKSLPVVDEAGCVVGILTETDILRRLNVNSFLELLVDLVADPGVFTHHCHDTAVSVAMTAPAITIPEEAGFRAIIHAFHEYQGRSLPVVDADGCLCGLLLRKDVIKAHHLEELL